MSSENFSFKGEICVTVLQRDILLNKKWSVFSPEQKDTSPWDFRSCAWKMY